MVCKKQVGHALSVPDREESHLLSEDLGSGEPVSRASARKKLAFLVRWWVDVLKFNVKILSISDKSISETKVKMSHR